MNKLDKIYIAGHNGLVGSAILRSLQKQGYNNLICKDKSELDLTHQKDVYDFFEEHRPNYVFLAAAMVGGIKANNSYPADFIRDNLLIQSFVIDAAYKNKVDKLLFLGSSCIYPRDCKQPMTEDMLLSGLLEPTNEAYAIAKIAGIKMCQAYNKQYGFKAISLMPTNLYGINDNFDIDNAHVVPAMLQKFHNAKLNNEKEVVIWGTGTPRRELMHSDDLADAAVFLMNNYNNSGIINVGTGVDLSIKEIAETIKQVVGYDGDVVFDTSKPDGTPRKLLDVSKINNLGWSAKIELEDGIRDLYEWYKEQI